MPETRPRRESRLVSVREMVETESLADPWLKPPETPMQAQCAEGGNMLLGCFPSATRLMCKRNMISFEWNWSSNINIPNFALDRIIFLKVSWLHGWGEGVNPSQDYHGNTTSSPCNTTTLGCFRLSILFRSRYVFIFAKCQMRHVSSSNLTHLFSLAHWDTFEFLRVKGRLLFTSTDMEVAGNGTDWEVKTIELSSPTSGGEQRAFLNFLILTAFQKTVPKLRKSTFPEYWIWKIQETSKNSKWIRVIYSIQ